MSETLHSLRCIVDLAELDALALGIERALRDLGRHSPRLDFGRARVRFENPPEGAVRPTETVLAITLPGVTS